ncbi:MAG: hypothetical protein QXV73_05115 [Candidatus Micrarchaeia archaeon]
MVNSRKRKGTDWERELVKLLEQIPQSKAKRIATSGAIGTYLEEPQLTGDVVLMLDDLPKKFRIECKVGYGGSVQITLKREWFDKIKKEAQSSYSIPLVALKFSGVREKDVVRYVIAMDLETFIDLMTYLVNLKLELDGLYERINILGRDKELL